MSEYRPIIGSIKRRRLGYKWKAVKSSDTESRVDTGRRFYNKAEARAWLAARIRAARGKTKGKYKGSYFISKDSIRVIERGIMVYYTIVKVD